MKKLAVIAFGGNALLRNNQKGTYQEQLENVMQTCKSLRQFYEQDYELVIGHGNGPQVGNVMLQHDAGEKQYGVAAMPMDLCVAETQGSIAYMIELGMRQVFHERGIDKPVISLVTQVVVDENDPAFQNPTKPVGPYYTHEEVAHFQATVGGKYAEDPKGNGWRKVVPSPKPLEISNIDTVGELARSGKVVITCGGGGIPVIKGEFGIKGIEAVIDKDLASALAAVRLQADQFYILTDVPKVYINFKKENEQALDRITVDEAKRYLAAGHFTEGSMAPKIRAAIFYVENGGKECIITEAKSLEDPKGGTRIVPN